MSDQKPSAEENPKREPRQKQKNNPRSVAAARELRDRWLEKINEDQAALQLNGKYDVTRALAQAMEVVAATPPPTRLLAA